MILTLIDPKTRAMVKETTGFSLPDERSPAFFGALDELESRFPALYAQVMATFVGPAQARLKQTLPSTRRHSPAARLWQRPVLAGRPVFDAWRLSAVALVCTAVCAAPVLVSQLSFSTPAMVPQPTLPQLIFRASVPPALKPVTALNANRNAAPTTLQVTPPVPSVSLPPPVRVLAPALLVALVEVPQAASQTVKTAVIPDARQVDGQQSTVALPKPTVLPKPTMLIVPAPPAPIKVATASVPSGLPAPAARILPPPPAQAQAEIQTQAKVQAQAKVLPPAPGPIQVAAPVIGPVQNVVKPVPNAAAKITVPVPAPRPMPNKFPVALKAPAAVKAASVSPVVIKQSADQPLPGSARSTDPESALTLYQNGVAPVSGSSGQLTSFSSGGLSSSSLPSDQGKVTQGEGGLTMYVTPVPPKP